MGIADVQCWLGLSCDVSYRGVRGRLEISVLSTSYGVLDGEQQCLEVNRENKLSLRLER